jgi:ABC-type multidrug transport system fused ATPase/permease subunit
MGVELGDASPAERQARARALTRLAALDAEIDELPKGYQTLLGERGVNLSGGQRQRVAIARAIGADPRLLVLDDCLSAVDARTEAAILGNLSQVFAGRSGAIISHRVRALAACDEILVLEQGRIVERGTHASLLAADGYYARIAREQTREDADDEVTP